MQMGAPFLLYCQGLLRKAGPLEDIFLGIYYRELTFCDGKSWLKVERRPFSI